MQKICTFIIFGLIFSAVSSYAQYTNIRVDGPPSIDPNEVAIAINPVNPNELAAGANINYLFSSTDGGFTWSTSEMSSTLGVWGDPCLLYDSLGYLYYAHLSYPGPGQFIDRIVVQRSTNNGQTWNDGAGIGWEPPKQQDKEWLAVDHTQSQFRGNIYTTWTEFDDYGSSNPDDSSRIKFSRSTDAGITWTPSITISDVSGDCEDGDNTTEGAVPAVGPEGQIYTAWAGPLGLVFDKSTDGGNTWGNDIFITDIPGGWAFDVSGISRCNGLPITMCDISNSPYRGNIYVGWSDQRNGATNTDVFIVKSTDGGETWNQPLRVNDDLSTRHQFFTWMTIDPATGHIWAVFYDRRNTTGDATDVFVARSTDGGDTFENFKVSQSSFTPVSWVFFGDYTNIAAWQGKIYPIWMRGDNSQLSVWVALVTDSSTITIAQDEIFAPDEFLLYQNYPNPFNPTTTLSYQLPEAGYVTLKVYDMLGNELETLVNAVRPAGVHEVTFNSGNLSSGLYLYKMNSGIFEKIRKMLLVK